MSGLPQHLKNRLREAYSKVQLQRLMEDEQGIYPDPQTEKLREEVVKLAIKNKI